MKISLPNGAETSSDRPPSRFKPPEPSRKYVKLGAIAALSTQGGKTMTIQELEQQVLSLDLSERIHILQF